MISKTIATSGGDYTTIAAWEAAISNTDNETGTCTSAAALQTSALTLNAANTGAYAYLLTANDSVKVSAPTAYDVVTKARITNTVTISGTGWIVEKIGITPDSGGFISTILSISAAATIRRCGFHLMSSTTNDFIAVSANTTIDNCYSTGAGTGVVLGNSAGTLNTYHCSIISESGGYAGYYTSGGTHNNYACACQGAGTNWKNDGGTFGGDYNLSQDTSAIGTNKWTSQSGIYLHEGNTENYLWLSAAGIDDEYPDDDTFFTSAPTNYSNLKQKTTGITGAGNCMVGAANRANTASSENPGAFTVDDAFNSREYTLAVIPSSSGSAPTVSSVIEFANSTAATGNIITYTVTAGHLVIIFIATGTATGFIYTDGWTDISLAGTQEFAVFAKMLDGTEDGNFGVLHSSTKMAALSYNIAGARGLPLISSVHTDTTAPDSNNLIPNAAEDLSLAVASRGDYAVADYSGTVSDVATDIVGTTRTGTIDVGVWQTPAVATDNGNFFFFM